MARGPRSDNRSDEQNDLVDKLVSINRVAKVVKGGRRFGFAALVVVGDAKGRVGFGTGKAREVPEAIRKATEKAKKSMVRVPLREGRTLHHDVRGRFGAGKVVLRAAPAGTGIIAGGPMRAVFETLGVQDVVAKSIGSARVTDDSGLVGVQQALSFLVMPWIRLCWTSSQKAIVVEVLAGNLRGVATR